jgi:hypothetical protein
MVRWPFGESQTGECGEDRNPVLSKTNASKEIHQVVLSPPFPLPKHTPRKYPFSKKTHHSKANKTEQT